MRATFDSNTLDRAARPERHPKDPRQPDFIKVHDAIKAGMVTGYFSETLVTLEGIENKDRVGVLGSTKLAQQIKSADQATIKIDVTPQQERKPLHPEHLARIEAALKIGMRALKAPPRTGWTLIKDADRKFFADDAEARIPDRMERTIDAVSNRGSRSGFCAN